MAYEAPVKDMLAALKASANLDAAIESGRYGELDEETIVAILTEAGSFSSEVLAPLNKTGDQAGCKLADGIVTTAPGFIDAYNQFVAAGWPALPCDEDLGGQNLPEIVSLAVSEIWNASNLSFGLCPLLTQGAIHALEAGGSDELKAKFLPNMVSGKWTGTMNLTEPQAGSDLSALRTRAERADDGSYRITGTKIFITFGEHDMSENIIHLVLARLPDAPAGTRGISLFVVPKFLVNDDGSLGERNDLVCAGIEHKLGIHASPTCVMQYGDKGGAVGYLVGEENRGLANMFVMMNSARLAVGGQGVALSEAATQHALAYAKERKQGQPVGSRSAGMVEIINHADVKRMLLTMKALTQATRMICFATAAALDESRLSEDESAQLAAGQTAAILTPVAKAFSTDASVEVASIGVQIHGGMGFVEETGAAQFLRDARILPIYEGSNGIQAIDLVTRKLPIAEGAAVETLIGQFVSVAQKAEASNQEGMGTSADRLSDGVSALREATHWMLQTLPAQPDLALAGAEPYLRLFGLVAGAAYLSSAALNENARPMDRELARFFAENLLPEAAGLNTAITTGGAAVLADIESEVFA